MITPCLDTKKGLKYKSKPATDSGTEN